MSTNQSNKTDVERFWDALQRNNPNKVGWNDIETEQQWAFVEALNTIFGIIYHPVKRQF